MAATDDYAGRHAQTPGNDFPGDGAEAVTPSDTVTLGKVSRALYVGGAGTVAVLMRDGTTVTFIGVLAGTVLPIRIQRVNLTNTNATNMVAIY